VRAGSLDEAFPGDPADRVIYASAVELGARLLTADRAIRGFDPARTVW
jgi:PIN domain nuclease of toxin-antitoxin system